MIGELFEKQRPLMTAGVVSIFGFAILAVIAMFDTTQILGINRWIKPMKFFISIAVFVWTTAVYLNFLKGFERAGRRISWALIVIFIIEMLVIVTQAARGAKSHFNIATPLDSMLYAVMGIAIGVSTLLMAYLLYLYFRAEIELSPTLVWALRLGLLIFLLGSLEGAYMSSQTGHTVGAVDGGEGLPFVNWSKTGGDLRVAHFFGLHAIQAVPLFALALERLKIKPALSLTAVFAFLYFAFFSFLFLQALLGKPVGF